MPTRRTHSTLLRTLTLGVAAVFTTIVFSCALHAEDAKPAERGPHPSGEFNVALDELGAVARLSKGPGFNIHWPPAAIIDKEGSNRRGILLNQMLGSAVEISLLKPVPITAIEIQLLDWHSTRFIKTADITINGQLAKQGVEFPAEGTTPVYSEEHKRIVRNEGPMVRVEFDKPVTGNTVTIEITEVHDPRVINPDKEPNPHGGISRVRVFSSEDISSYLGLPDAYKVAERKALAHSAALAAVPKTYSDVRTTPKGVNPNTIWDAKDIERMREMLKKSPEMQKQVAEMRERLDKRMEQPFNIPKGEQDDKGEWIHVSDSKTGWTHINISLEMRDYAILYALTGDAKYAEFAKKYLLAAAAEYQNYRPGNRPGFSHDVGMLHDQRLGDAIYLLSAARAYDLIANLPSWTPDERTKVTDDFLKHLAYFCSQNRIQLMAPTNWSAIITCGVMITGYATHDEKLIDIGHYGWTDHRGDRHGGMYYHFGPESIGADGLWAEGAMGYQDMAVQALIAYAEIMRHHGVDLYAYRDGAFKHLLDSPVWFAYPDYNFPALHDSGSNTILGPYAKQWEYGYLRYRDPNYLTLLKGIPLSLRSQIQIYTESVLYDLDRDQSTPPITVGSVNLHDVGYGITRINAGEAGTRYMLFDYGPHRSHSHLDKLQVDIWANDEQLAIDPGMVWYEQPMYDRWYNKTFAHNLLVVDESDQRACTAVQTVFAAGETVAMQRGYTNEAVPGVTLDRSLFMFEHYVLDLFGAFAKMPRLFDMVWHIRGDFELPAGMKDRSEPLTALAYKELDDVQELTTADAFAVNFTSPLKGTKTRFLTAPAPDTTYITGLGHYVKERPLTIFARRKAADTVFASTLDYSGTGEYVKSIATSGGMAQGYYLAKTTTKDGTDLCYTSFNGAKNTADILTTDALQAIVRLGKGPPHAPAIAQGKVLPYTAAIAGGKVLILESSAPDIHVGSFSLTLANQGTVIVERTSAGTWLITNLDNAENTLKLTADFTRDLRIVTLNPDGSHTAAAPAPFTGTLVLLPLAKFELLPAGHQGYFKASYKIRSELQATAEKAAAEAKAESANRSKERRAAAAASPVPTFRLEIPGVAFTAQTGGTVNKATDRVGAKSPEIFWNWQGDNFAITWEVEVPAEGYYVIGMRYCTSNAAPKREITINGIVQEPLSPFVFPTTGGFARTTDDWKIAFAKDSIDDQPLLIKLNKGKNTIKLTDFDNLGVNVDYLIVASPDAATAAK